MNTSGTLNIVPTSFLTSLDKFQLPAATCGLGPKRCNAGAGSGKTTVYAHRVVFLLKNGVQPDNILATTFTKKAATEMKERIEKVAKKNGVEADLSKMWIGTFHSLGVKAIREYSHVVGYDEKFTIIDDDDQEAIIKKLMNDNPAFEGIKINIKNIVGAISFARNSGREYVLVFQEKLWQIANHAALVDVALAYEKKKREMNAMDFDDLIIYWLEILKYSPSARNAFQDRFHHILVDEYQDTNHIQNEIIDILSAKNRNIFVVGDDWQSIYAFRAAEVMNIIDFDKRYPDCETFVLANNYRSTPEIVNLASACISNNLIQLKKDVEAPNEGGEKPKIVIVTDDYAQVDFIIRGIQTMANKGISYKRMAVLYRNNNMSTLLEKELNKKLIPYVKKGAQFWKKAHIKLALSWLKMIQNPLENANVIRCAEMFSGVGKAAVNNLLKSITSYEEFEAFLAGEIIPDPKKPALFEDFRRILVDIETIIGENEQPVKDAVDYIVKFLIPHTQDHWKGDEGENRVDDFGVLVELSSQFESIQELLDAIALQEEQKNKKDKEAVTLSTGHGAKGLEWDIVFMIGLSEEVFPHKNVKPGAEYEEERRLFYVMMTRAKQRLYLISPKRINQWGKEIYVNPSPFLQELPQELYDLREINS